MFCAVRSAFRKEKKLSIAALATGLGPVARSQKLSERLIEQVMLWSTINRGNWSLVYWLPRPD